MTREDMFSRALIKHCLFDWTTVIADTVAFTADKVWKNILGIIMVEDVYNYIMNWEILWIKVVLII